MEETELETCETSSELDDSCYDVLPTGKKHISFSETKDWVECSYRHKLKHVCQLGENKPGIHMDFGTACHSVCEHYLKTKVLDLSIFKKSLFGLWKEHEGHKGFDVKSFKQFAKEGLEVLPELPDWLDTTFPGWETVDAEHFLYEQIDRHPHAFKGYVDCIIKVPHKKSFIYWVIDFKTCSWGWTREKKNDPTLKMQLMLYRNFVSKKMNIPLKDIKCAFALLKRQAKAGSRIELVTVTTSENSHKYSLNVINNMLVSVKRNVAIKNRNSCKFCEFFQTSHCT